MVIAALVVCAVVGYNGRGVEREADTSDVKRREFLFFGIVSSFYARPLTLTSL